MPLPPGTAIGSFEIISPVGAGGMGEVYRARDRRLKRDVALKVLPEGFASDPDRMARFEREAHVLASLNHPNIAAIYGVEDRALVMEMIEGQTLAERLAAGPVPLEEALAISRQIAAALDYAHEKSVVHRDLKPANIKITPDGVVKVLDFGLAKIAAPPAASQDSAGSRTVTVRATHAGMILGTAAYMSPEQARGREADKRSDIWAFGVVLYEVLSGRPAFDGDSVTDVLSAVISKEPGWAHLPAGAPAALLKRCLEKDPRRRLRDIGDALPELEHPLPSAASAVAAPRRYYAAYVLAALLAASLTLSAYLWMRPANQASLTAHLAIPLGADEQLADSPAISSDGKIIAYALKQADANRRLYLRKLDSFAAEAVPGSNGAVQPFFSPDGHWVAFFAQGGLYKAPVTGGSPVRLANAAFPFGGTWNQDGTIIFASSIGSGLLRIPASGGKIEVLTQPDGAAAGFSHSWPYALPSGRSVLFTLRGQRMDGNAELSLETRRWQIVLPGRGGAIFSPSGHLLVSDESAAVRAAAFRPGRPARSLADSSVLSDVYFAEDDERPWLATSKTGVAVYASGNPGRRSLTWVNRDGKAEPLKGDQTRYGPLALSPDGTRAVVKEGPDLWIHDFSRSTRRRLTFHSNAEGNAASPVWSRDGARVIYSSTAGGDYDIYSQYADGSQAGTVLLKRRLDQYPDSVTPDGTILFAEAHPDTSEDLWALSADGRTSALRVTRFNENTASVSPDGRWVAYESDESGRFEIYLQRYPVTGERIAVSTSGGNAPVWSGNGRELFFCSAESMMVAAIGPQGVVGTPRPLFSRAGYFILWHSYDVTPDGKRFLMVRPAADSAPRSLHVILNWLLSGN